MLVSISLTQGLFSRVKRSITTPLYLHREKKLLVLFLPMFKLYFTPLDLVYVFVMPYVIGGRSLLQLDPGWGSKLWCWAFRDAVFGDPIHRTVRAGFEPLWKGERTFTFFSFFFCHVFPPVFYTPRDAQTHRIKMVLTSVIFFDFLRSSLR